MNRRPRNPMNMTAARYNRIPKTITGVIAKYYFGMNMEDTFDVNAPVVNFDKPTCSAHPGGHRPMGISWETLRKRAPGDKFYCKCGVELVAA